MLSCTLLLISLALLGAAWGALHYTANADGMLWVQVRRGRAGQRWRAGGQRVWGGAAPFRREAASAARCRLSPRPTPTTSAGLGPPSCSPAGRCGATR